MHECPLIEVLDDAKGVTCTPTIENPQLGTLGVGVGGVT